MGRACSAYGEEKRFWWENLEERLHLRDPDVGGRITLWWVSGRGKWGCGLDLAGSGKGQAEGACD